MSGEGNGGASQAGLGRTRGATSRSHGAAAAAPAPTSEEAAAGGGGAAGGGLRGGGCTNSSSSSSSGQRAGGVDEEEACEAAARRLLANVYLGEFGILLDRLQLTQCARPLNKRNVAILKESFLRTKGFSPEHPISVTFMSVSDSTDDFTGADADAAGTAYVFDGNHRVAAMREILRTDPGFFGEDFKIPCRCHRDIPDKPTKRIVAQGLNTTAHAIAVSTIYDKLFFFTALYREIQATQATRRGRRSTDREIGYPEVASSYKVAKTTPPREGVVRNWLKVVKGIGAKAVDTLQALSQSNDDAVNIDVVSLEFLKSAEFLDADDFEQAVALECLVRWAKANAKPFKRKNDTAPLMTKAKLAACWGRALATIVAEDDWSYEMKKEFADVVYANPARWSFQATHMDRVEKDVRILLQDLPEGTTIDDSIVDTVRAQQPQKMVSILNADSRLRPLHETFLKRLEDAKNVVALKRLNQRPSPAKGAAGRRRVGRSSTNGGSGDEEDENDDEDEDEEDDDEEDDEDDEEQQGNAGNGKGKQRGSDNNTSPRLCQKCKPSANCRYHCPLCGVIHQSFCDAAVAMEGANPLSSYRRCLVCENPDVGSGGKRSSAAGDKGGPSKRNKALQLPGLGASHGDVRDIRMAETAHIHDDVFVSPKVADMSLETHVVPKFPEAKLVLLYADMDKSLSSPGAPAGDRIAKLLRAVMANRILHPDGTIVVGIPQPVHDHMHKWAEALKQPGVALEVEEHPLMVQFISKGGGRPGATTGRRHLKGMVHQSLVAHHPGERPGPGRFTCNEHVTTEDPLGAIRSGTSYCHNLMKDVEFEGAKTIFPRRMVNMLICRYTNPGDVVVSTSGDRDAVIECSLSLARKVEVYPGDIEDVEVLGSRVAEAFALAWSNGFFQNSENFGGGRRIIEGKLLPERVPSHTTPIGVSTAIQDAMKSNEDPGPAPSANSVITVAKQMATTLGYAVREDDDGHLTAYTNANEAYNTNSSDMFLWGTLEIHHTDADASASVALADGDDRLRLIRVTDHEQLKALLDGGKELVREGACLYMRIAATCPAFYVQLGTDDDRGHHEIKSEVHSKLKDSTPERVFRDAEGAAQTPVKLAVYKAIKKSGSGQVVKCRPSPFVVRGSQIPSEVSASSVKSV